MLGALSIFRIFDLALVEYRFDHHLTLGLSLATAHKLLIPSIC